MVDPKEGPQISSKILKTVWDFSPAEAEALNPPGRRRMNPFSARVARRTRGVTDPNGEGQVFPLITDLIQCIRRSGLVATSRRFRIQSEELRNLTRFMAIYGVSSLRYVLRQAKGPRLLEGKARWERSDFLEGITSLTADGSPPDGIACDCDGGTAQYEGALFQGVTDPEPSPVKNDRLLRDIALLNKVANDAGLPASKREAAAKWRDFLVRENVRIERVSALAEMAGIRSQFEALSDVDLAKWISEALVKDGKDGPFSFVYSLAQVYCEYYPLPDFIFHSFGQTLIELFSAGLVNEFGRRCSQHETKGGRAVSELVVEVPDRNQILLALGKQAAKGFWCHGETPGKSTEAPSMAHTFIWESLINLLPAEVLTTDKVPATEPRFLEALIDGAFNKILQQAKEHVRAKIKTEIDRGELLKFDSDAVEKYTCVADQAVLPDGEYVKGNLEAVTQQKVLLQQLVSKANLNGKDKKSVESYLSGQTQEEIAENLSVTQPTVSNRFRSIATKMRRLINDDQNPSG